MKTILLDIETAPSLAYVWGVWKQNVGQKQLASHTRIMSCAVKDLEGDDIRYYESRGDNDREIVQKIIKELDDADFVIAHNGKKFDIPVINARAVVNGIKPPSPYRVIDTLLIAKREFRFIKNSLENLAIELNVPSRKLGHGKYPGFELWLACMAQDDEAWDEMREYNCMDVQVLEEVYLRMRPWYSIHPNVSTGNKSEEQSCPKCGGADLMKRGYFYTNKGQYQRYMCKGCGAWSSATNTQNTKEKRKSLLASR